MVHQKQAKESSPKSAAGRSSRREVMGLPDSDFAVLAPNYHRGIGQVDQVFILQPSQGQQDLIGFLLIIKTNYH